MPDGAPPPPLSACVLFRPGHYDMLTPIDWGEPSLLAADGECFVPPLPPRRPPPGQPCESCRGPAQLLGCWLCEKPVCTNARCPAAAAAVRAAPPTAKPHESNRYRLPEAFGSERPEGGVCAQCISRCPHFSIHVGALGLKPMRSPPPA